MNSASTRGEEYLLCKYYVDASAYLGISHVRLHIRCEDPSVDLCPSGHLSFGLVTAVAIAIPGALIALSEFRHFRAFRFGAAGKLRGQNLNR